MRRTTLLLCGGVVMSLAACAGGGEAAQPDIDRPNLTIAAAVGDKDFFSVDVDLGVAFCSTAVACPTDLHGEPVLSLVTGATCSMPYAWDGYLLFARRLACYTGGTLNDPTTWTGESVVEAPATTTGERAYGAVVASIDTQYVNSSQYLEPLGASPPQHCYYEAEALIAPTVMETATRSVYHRQNPARLTWGVVYEPGAASDVCHFAGSPALSGVDVDYPASLTVSKPAAPDDAKGDYPVTVDYATVWPATHGAAGAARIRYVLGATTPATPTGLSTWAERDLWVSNGSGTAIDAEIDSTCARMDAGTGALVSIGVLLRDATGGDLLGAVEVLSDDGVTRFDCVRDTDTSCTYRAYTTEPGGQGVCTDLITRCHDGAKNFDETDVDCGGSCGGCGTGGACASDADCLSGYCDGGTSRCVDATSCLALYTARPSSPDGRYELDPDGAGGAAPFIAYCDMAGGGWTLVMTLAANAETGAAAASQNLTYGATYWNTTDLLNAAHPRPVDNVLTATDAKYPAYNTVGGDTLRLAWLAPSGVAWEHTFGSSTTALSVFSASSALIGGDESVAACNGSLLAAVENYSASAMAFAQGSQFYGFNGAGAGSSTSRVRWGFGSNDETTANPGTGAVWEPLVGIGSTTASAFWTYESDCDNCSCYGSGAQTYAATAANLWIK